METSDKPFDSLVTKNDTTLKIPGPPPNPRRRNTPHPYGAAAVIDPIQALQDVTQQEDGDSAVEETVAQSYQPPVVQDMSSSAELKVSMEEVKAPYQAKGDTNEVAIPAPTNNNQTTTRDFPVFYSKQNGDVALRSDTVKPQPDGRQVIQTSYYQSPPNRYETDQPLTKRRQRILKIMSIVAAVLFFPTGIPAAYFAFKTEKEFDAGILRGDIDKARKCAKRAEKLIIFSFLLFIMVVVLSFALYERSKWTDADFSGHRILPNPG